MLFVQRGERVRVHLSLGKLISGTNWSIIFCHLLRWPVFALLKKILVYFILAIEFSATSWRWRWRGGMAAIISSPAVGVLVRKTPICLSAHLWIFRDILSSFCKLIELAQIWAAYVIWGLMIAVYSHLVSKGAGPHVLPREFVRLHMRCLALAVTMFRWVCHSSFSVKWSPKYFILEVLFSIWLPQYKARRRLLGHLLEKIRY